MQLIHQTVIAVLVTPTEGYEGGEYFSFALSLSNGEVYRIGTSYPIGVALLTATEIHDEGWLISKEYANLVGKQIAGVYGPFGNTEPYLHFTDGTMIHVTGEECGTVIEISTLDEIRQNHSWIVETWKRVDGVT
jgi:hypothetical protein